MWKRFVEDYLGFSHKERTGIYVLLGLIIFCILLPFLYPLFIREKKYDHRKFEREIAALQRIQVDSQPAKYQRKKNTENSFADYAGASGKSEYELPATVFYFDPNNATPMEWRRLGIKQRTVETIQKYLLKGGHFYKAEDIAKIWGLTPADVKRLVPYARVAPPQTAYTKNAEHNKAEVTPAVYSRATFKLLDINKADTTAFIELPGIGNTLARRIVNFRDKLGGFYAVEQVGETFGLPDSTFQKIRSRLITSALPVKKMNINTVLIEELKVHPYIRYKLANAIIQYRTLHGNFSSVNDVKKVMLVTDVVFNKMEPYITISEQ